MSQPQTSRKSAESVSRWPLSLGAIGIVVGVIMILDQLGDLWVAQFWTAEEWRHLIGRELGDFLSRSMPSQAWKVTASLIKLALGILLVLGSTFLRRRRRLGATLCRSWAGIAIAWLVVEGSQGLMWLARYAGEIPGVPAEGWQGTAGCSVVFAFALLLVWPVVLLVWLSRPGVRRETAGWPP